LSRQGAPLQYLRSPAGTAAIDYKALVQDDRIHASLYTDPRIFDDEMDRIFHLGAATRLIDRSCDLAPDGAVALTAGWGKHRCAANWKMLPENDSDGYQMHWWAGRVTHRLRRVGAELRMAAKKVVLVNAAEPLPNLSFLI
jgi:hypothetical protein